MRNPLDVMRIRSHQFRAYRPLSNTFGVVRVNNTRAHQGWDLQAPPGTPVFAITYGVAESMPYHQDWGNRVRLQFTHRGQIYYAFYAHLGTALFDGGGSVAEGGLLGFTGMTGNASGLPQAEAHLHFGISINPNPRRGMNDYLDPGMFLGYEVYSSQ